ncbi:hypothetical protein GMRT_10854 [Giardia muris]|uniref:Uncharacterized protein n=1 Tax=Giardia muris TaxID=5742 RepID=A0A4Z1SPH9_GIAMU|nr:hypothetical protein GMRT_10854 [Giardia muris]|eukprot:TNJ27550.1 hypothetical protein GMRT_10854 [Giardia muris]
MLPSDTTRSQRPVPVQSLSISKLVASRVAVPNLQTQAQSQTQTKFLDTESLILRSLEAENTALREQIAGLLQREKRAQQELEGVRRQVLASEARASSLADEMAQAMSKELTGMRQKVQEATDERDKLEERIRQLEEEARKTTDSTSSVMATGEYFDQTISQVIEGIINGLQGSCSSLLPSYIPGTIPNNPGIVQIGDLVIPTAIKANPLLTELVCTLYASLCRLNTAAGDLKLVTEAFRSTAMLVKDRLMRERDALKNADVVQRAELAHCQGLLETQRNNLAEEETSRRDLEQRADSLQKEGVELTRRLQEAMNTLEHTSSENIELQHRLEQVTREKEALESTTSGYAEQLAELRGIATRFRVERDEATERVIQLERTVLALTDQPSSVALPPSSLNSGIIKQEELVRSTRLGISQTLRRSALQTSPVDEHPIQASLLDLAVGGDAVEEALMSALLRGGG